MQDKPSKLSPSGINPAGRKIHPTAEDKKANITKKPIIKSDISKKIKIKVEGKGGGLESFDPYGDRKPNEGITVGAWRKDKIPAPGIIIGFKNIKPEKSLEDFLKQKK